MTTIKAPFFEIGPKSYLYGDEILELAQAADAASEKYGVDIIFTCPVVDIRRVKENTKRIHVFAPHMDPIPVGRGLADILPESLVAAGAEGVMLNHVEKPLDFETLAATIKRAEEVGLTTIVCADSEAEAAKIATLNPDIIVAEPSALIGHQVRQGCQSRYPGADRCRYRRWRGCVQHHHRRRGCHRFFFRRCQGC